MLTAETQRSQREIVFPLLLRGTAKEKLSLYGAWIQFFHAYLESVKSLRAFFYVFRPLNGKHKQT